MWFNGLTVSKALVSSNLMTAAKISLFINHPSDLMDSVPSQKAIVSNSPSPPATMRKPRLLMSPVLTALLCSPGRIRMAVEAAVADLEVDLGALRDVTVEAAVLDVTTVVILATSRESVTGAIIPVEAEVLAVTTAVILATSLGIATGSIIPAEAEEVLVTPAALLVTSPGIALEEAISEVDLTAAVEEPLLATDAVESGTLQETALLPATGVAVEVVATSAVKLVT